MTSTTATRSACRRHQRHPRHGQLDGTHIRFMPDHRRRRGPSNTSSPMTPTPQRRQGQGQRRSTNHAPIAATDVFEIDEDTPFEFTTAQLLGNDSDPDGDASPSRVAQHQRRAHRRTARGAAVRSDENVSVRSASATRSAMAARPRPGDVQRRRGGTMPDRQSRRGGTANDRGRIPDDAGPDAGNRFCR